MKKMLALLASVSLGASSIATVGCSIGDSKKALIANMVERVMYTSSYQAKAAIINSEKGISANYLLNTWKSNSIGTDFSNHQVSDLSGNDVRVQSLFNSLFGNFNYSINNVGGNETVIGSVQNNLNSLKQDSLNPSSSTLQILKTVGQLAKVFVGTGIGTDLGGIVAGLLNQNGGIIDQIKVIADNGGFLDVINNFFENNADLLDGIIGGLTWDGINEFDTTFKNEDTTFEDAFEISQKYLAHSLNQILTNKKGEKNPNSNNKDKTSIADTVTWTLNKLVAGDLQIGDFKEILGPLLTWVRLIITYLDSYAQNGAFDYKSNDVNHIFSASETNTQYKAKMHKNKIWENSLVRDNAINVSGLFKMLAKILTPEAGDVNGIGLQKIVYILIGDIKENESIDNSTQLGYEALKGVYEFIIQYLADVAGIPGFLINLVLGTGIKQLLNPITKSFSNNTSFDDFWSGLAGLIDVVTGNLLWGIISNKIPEGINKDMIKKLLQDFSKGLKKPEFLIYYNNYLGSLQNGEQENNLFNKIVKSFEVATNDLNSEAVAGLNALLESLLGGNFDIGQTMNGFVDKIEPTFDKIENWNNFASMPIKDILDLFGLANFFNGEFGRLLYTIKNYSLKNIFEYLDKFFNKDKIAYQLHLGNIAYLVECLKNKVTINGSEQLNIFQILKNFIGNPKYKTTIKKVKFSDDEEIIVEGNQTAAAAILGLKIGKKSNTLIKHSTLSGISSVFGPAEDWTNSDFISQESVAANFVTLNRILDLFINLTGRLEASNNKWIEDNVNIYTNSSNWNYELVHADNLNVAATQKVSIKYNLYWNIDNQTKKYEIEIIRDASQDIYTSTPWRIASIYDLSKK
ncbi:MOLPALP family lipoprotein [Williamsoniiplasma somnilux]|uniref:MOLPALP family lipoprotein n=1 Tax=Williamsoniiplasma somnilux TaxID=215578 RepID=A0A2K8NZ69_9MOLU|nr:MOLPALP family lipoprotein [Williamsoniiplasma somnilux]ATZ19087.1 MOLPALP family lipoprotein [Williamsoniiplasma somnilux]